MLKETNLKKIKEVAISLVYTDLHIDEQIDFFCHHPFFQTTSTYNPKTGEFYDLKDEKELSKARNMINEQISETNNFWEIQMMVQKPYLPVLFKYCEKFLNQQDYADALTHLWITVEFPNHDANVSVEEFLKYFSKADKELLMGKDIEKYNSLPDKITVYRGTCLKSTTKALSWTTNIEKARWFANRFGNNGKVYEATIDKKDIFAYFTNRGESEVVLNYKKLEKIRKIEDFLHDKNSKEELR
jgi:hypothetical protein